MRGGGLRNSVSDTLKPGGSRVDDAWGSDGRRRSMPRPIGSTCRGCGRSRIPSTSRSGASRLTAAFGGTSVGSTSHTFWPLYRWGSSRSPPAPGMCSLVRSTSAGLMSATTAFTIAEAVSNANATCHPSGDNTSYPSAETFNAAVSAFESPAAPCARHAVAR